MADQARFITIAFSHYCEKVRWALDRLAVPYREESHLPILHRRASRGIGGGNTVPVLKIDGKILSDSTDILKEIDRRAPEGARLYPSAPELRRECEALEEQFDEKLGPATRRLVYFHLLPHRSLLMKLIQASGPGWQVAIVRTMFPVVRTIMQKGMNITPETSARSSARIDEIFKQVGERLSDGRRYLIGDTFTAADLTFAALAAPVVYPAAYGFPMPPLEEVPVALREIIETLRATPAGRFALRLYEEERGRVVGLAKVA